MVCLGFEPGAAWWKARTNPLSYGCNPQDILKVKKSSQPTGVRKQYFHIETKLKKGSIRTNDTRWNKKLMGTGLWSIYYRQLQR